MKYMEPVKTDICLKERDRTSERKMHIGNARNTVYHDRIDAFPKLNKCSPTRGNKYNIKVQSKSVITHTTVSKIHKADAEVPEQKQDRDNFGLISVGNVDDENTYSQSFKFTRKSYMHSKNWDDKTESGSCTVSIQDGTDPKRIVSWNSRNGTENNLGNLNTVYSCCESEAGQSNQTRKGDRSLEGTTTRDHEDYSASPEKLHENPVGRTRYIPERQRMKSISRKKMQDIYKHMTDLEDSPQIMYCLKRAISEMNTNNYDKFSRATNGQLY